MTFTHGRIVPTGAKARRKLQKRADYILYYRLAVVEAKDKSHHPADGLPQVKEYAHLLGIRFAYATNGREILEFDLETGELKEIDSFPSPESLWQRANPLGEL